MIGNIPDSGGARKPGTDGTASEFPAKGAGNSWQSRQSPEDAARRGVRMLESFFHMAKSIDELQDIAKRIRRDIVQMITAAKSGHPGGSLSAVEIVVELYFNHMRIDPANPKWADRDRFILSKGHAAPVLYSVMAERGYADAPKDKLNT